jgi:uncharacterized membrane protein (UPF0127 family)
MAPSGRTIAIAAIVVVGLILVYGIYQATNGPGTVTTRVPSGFTVNGRTYTFTYVATNQSERQTGLMNRKVTNTTTMLFAFPYPSTWTFWMYNTNTSLDMIWVNATVNPGRVVYVVASAQPCYNLFGLGCTKYTPTEPANYVIEAKAGFAAANDIANGTSITFN